MQMIFYSPKYIRVVEQMMHNNHESEKRKKVFRLKWIELLRRLPTLFLFCFAWNMKEKKWGKNNVNGRELFQQSYVIAPVFFALFFIVALLAVVIFG